MVKVVYCNYIERTYIIIVSKGAKTRKLDLAPFLFIGNYSYKAKNAPRGCARIR